MFRRLEPIKRACSLNPKTGCRVTSLPQPSIVQPMMQQKVTYFVGDEKKEAVSYVNDIYLLFNQRRLLSAGVDTINAWLNTLTPRSDALSELRKKCTDEQLMQLCKSRYIQSPSELLAWSDYLLNNYQDILSEAEQQMLQQQQQQTEPTEPTELQPTEPPTSE